MTQEWTVYDCKKDDLILVNASSQKEAIVKGMERGLKPRGTNDCRPRTGDADLMDAEEFRGFVGKAD